MRYTRVEIDGQAHWAVADGEVMRPLPAGATLQGLFDGVSYPRGKALSAFTCLPPLEAQARIFCIGRNYRDHAAEMGGGNAMPSIFSRDPASFVGHRVDLVRPAISTHYDFEGEIALVIHGGGRSLTGAAAAAAIGGYTLAMDGSVRDYQQHSLFAGKNFERSGGLGPAIVIADEIPNPAALAVETHLNGVRMQHGLLADLIVPPADLVAYLSAILTLRTGDIILTGTPAGVGAARTPPLWLQPDDVLCVSAMGLGALEHRIASARN